MTRDPAALTNDTMRGNWTREGDNADMDNDQGDRTRRQAQAPPRNKTNRTATHETRRLVFMPDRHSIAPAPFIRVPTSDCHCRSCSRRCCYPLHFLDLRLAGKGSERDGHSGAESHYPSHSHPIRTSACQTATRRGRAGEEAGDLSHIIPSRIGYCESSGWRMSGLGCCRSQSTSLRCLAGKSDTGH